MHGWIIVDKPVGPGSTQVVSAVKRAMRAGGYAKVKVGHGGTLDPLACGVLPVALGEATKLAGRMLDADKVYNFTIGFGVATDSQDAEGAVVETCDHRPLLADVLATLPAFTGPIEQIPPNFSAIKIDGARAYARARAGEAIDMPARAVTIHAIALACPHPAGPLEQVTLSARVSKGTYIRSLARDIAATLETCGHVTMLRRVRAGPFDLGRAITLDNLATLGQERRLEHILLPLTAGLDDIPALSVTPDQAGSLRQGRKLIGIAVPLGLHLAIDRTVPVALVEQGEDGLRVVRGFNLPDVEDQS